VVKRDILRRVINKTLRFLSLWLPSVLWAALIFKFSSGSVPSASQVYWQDFIAKKIGHFILFAILSVFVYRGLIGEGVNRKKAAILAVAVAFLYGASDEMHQMFTQGREARIRDVLIDGLGAAATIFLIYKYFPRFPKSLRETLLNIGIK
jgi:hypothetical protein